MALTVTTFVANLTAMSVTGVTRKYTSQPSMVNDADLPSLYPRLPSQAGEIIAFTGVAGLDSMTVELVVLVEAIPQSTHAVSFAATVTAIDNLVAALKVEMAANDRIDSWSITADFIDIGASLYWGLIATVEGSG